MASEPQVLGWCPLHGAVGLDFNSCTARVPGIRPNMQCRAYARGPGADAALALAREVEGLRAQLARRQSEASRETPEIATLRRRLAKAEDASQKAMEARQALPSGSSRAKVTRANAKWATAAEDRDRIKAALDAALQKERSNDV